MKELLLLLNNLLIHEELLKMFLFTFIGLYIIFRDAKSIINFLSKVAIAYSIVVLLFQ
ncbi:hypothetical protein HYI07_06805 [Clostridium botulinum]|nr:hypothetical protein [Clostridium botulinum]MBD5561698.1 hypothetical protein [Clostridium botulinum]MBD5565365.1 hypothetical protein [Clostridium botulinum]MBD5570630.1 hypothetical protein [Clostridium botulinum]MBD5574849.1 hypothetical protein [Clostridium botulinum]MBD5578278.1 hypothetical protein [Clostridium botulinum]